MKNNFLQALVGRKKTACKTNEIKKYLHCCKEKMLSSYIIIQRALQNHSETATILPLIATAGDAAE